jgi:membrane-bound lytic murein transglycosylase D
LKRDPIGAARAPLLHAALAGLVVITAGCAGVGPMVDAPASPAPAASGSRTQPAIATERATDPSAPTPRTAPGAPIVATAPATPPVSAPPGAPTGSQATAAPAPVVPAARVDAAPVLAAPVLAAPAPAAPVVPAVPLHGDVWQRMRAGFAMPDLTTPLVQEKERFYRSNPEALNRMFTRGGRYLHFIIEEIEKRGMPTEIALLPFVESAMNPVALSPAQAAGLWQFIPSTGRAYELSQNWWVDNRRDVVQSTRAALDYLQKIYEMNERDWFLALASYNWGENAVARAVKNNRARGLPVDYLSLSMPAETRHYVPKLIALKHIVMRAGEYGIALPDIPNRPYFATIEKTRPIDLKLAAQFAGMSVEEFVALNPAHNRPVIAASRNNQIKLPADRVDEFVKAVERHERQNKPLASWQPYTVQPGESIEEIARRGNVTAAELLRANGISGGRRILPGTQLIAPQATVKDERQVEAFEGPKVYEQVTVGAVYHRVSRRETIGSIASSYGVSVTQLKAWNGGVSAPKPGTSLLVRPAATQTVMTTPAGSRQVLAARSLAPSDEPAAPRAAAAAAPAAERRAPVARDERAAARRAPTARTGSTPASVPAVYKPPRPAAKADPKAAAQRPRT